MKLGLLAGPFAQLSFEELLRWYRAAGLDAIELAAGAWPGTPHVNPSRAISDRDYAALIRSSLDEADLELSALAVHGNPLHPKAEIREAHAEALAVAIDAAPALGTTTVTCFSGCPGGRDDAGAPAWITYPWPKEQTDLLEWQWQERVVPFWRDVTRRAGECGVSIAIEMHPGMVVYNTSTLLALREATGPEVGANLDPSHLWWQGIDPCEAARALGREGAIHHVHAKDMELAPAAVRVNGVLDTTPFRRAADRAWIFRTVGYGHDESFWRSFVSTLRVVGYDGVLSIEHEDILASREEGVRRAIDALRRCVLHDPPAEPWWT